MAKLWRKFRLLNILLFTQLGEGCHTFQTEKSLNMLKEWQDLQGMNCHPLLNVLPPSSVNLESLKAPKVVISSIDSTFTILQGLVDPKADVIFYEACKDEHIKCLRGLLYSHSQFESRFSEGKYKLIAYSCVWPDRAYQKENGFRKEIPEISERHLYCGPIRHQQTFYQPNKSHLQIKPRQHSEELFEKQIKLHQKIYDFQKIIGNYKENANSPPPELLHVLNQFLYMRDKVHSLVLEEHFQKVLQQVEGLLQSYNTAPHTQAFYPEIMPHCAPQALITHFLAESANMSFPLYPKTLSQSLPKFGDQDLPSSTTLVAMSPLAISLLAQGSLIRLGANEKKIMTYEELAAYTLNSQPADKKEGQTLFTGVGIAHITSIFLNLAETYRVNKSFAAEKYQHEQRLFEQLARWENDFAALLHDYLQAREILLKQAPTTKDLPKN